ncbi:MAG: response regulator [Ardenticatenaceae bacterium]|nr:response regulator [Ardenticatenaceae bacterium]
MSNSEATFLYVDDDPLSRDVLQILLHKVMGFSQIEFFEHSNNFVERVQALPAVPSIIFLDIEVRPHNGYEMLALLRDIPTYQEVPIIAVTAQVMAADVDKLRETGFTGLIGKPIDNRLFPQFVNQILQGQAVWHIS